MTVGPYAVVSRREPSGPPPPRPVNNSVLSKPHRHSAVIKRKESDFYGSLTIIVRGMQGGLESGLMLKVLTPKLGLGFWPCKATDEFFF